MTTPTLVFGEPEDPLASTLRRLQQAILLHPVAAQAIFAAFIREGRAYARTEAGQTWLARLAGSELVVRARVLWDAMTVRGLEDDPDTVLPSAILEAFVKAAADADMERFVEDLFVRGGYFAGGER